jgi:photosystem II stability/assembly factor-like uncharacterized protein
MFGKAVVSANSIVYTNTVSFINQNEQIIYKLTSESGESTLGIIFISESYKSVYPMELFATADKSILAYTSERLFKSSDLGGTWKEIVTNPPSRNIVLHPSGDLYGLSQYGYPENILKSNDNGDSWTVLGTNLPISSGISYVGPSIAPDGTLFLAVNTPLENEYSYSVELWRSDNGISWISQGVAYSGRSMAGILRSINNSSIVLGLFTGEPGGGALIWSTNSGESWSVVVPPDSKFYIGYELVVANDVIYTISGNRLYSSADFGRTWKYLENPYYWIKNIHDLAVGVNGAVYIATEWNAVYKLNGTIWNEVGWSDPGAIATILIIDEKVYYAGLFNEEGTTPYVWPL